MPQKDNQYFSPEEKRIIKAFTGRLSQILGLTEHAPMYSHQSMEYVQERLNAIKERITQDQEEYFFGSFSGDKRKFKALPPIERKVYSIIYDLAAQLGLDKGLRRKANGFPGLEEIMNGVTLQLNTVMHDIESKEREKRGRGKTIKDKEEILLRLRRKKS